MTKTGDFLRSLLGWDSDSTDIEPITRDSNQLIRGDVSVEPFVPPQGSTLDLVDEIRYLDTMLEDTPYTGQFMSDVVNHRKLLFNSYTNEEICNAIQKIYEQEQEQAGLFALYRCIETDCPIVKIQTDMEFTHDIDDVQTLNSVRNGIEEYQVNENVTPITHSIDVIQDSVTEAVRHHLTSRATLAYTELPIDDATEAVFESTEQLDAAISSIWEHDMKPTDAVINADRTDSIGPFGGVHVHGDITDTVDVPCIVANSDMMGYEIVQQDVTVEPNMNGPNRYEVEWIGSFECMNPDALAVAE